VPYQTTQDLPESVQQVLPDHAQRIYLEAFNHAWAEYKYKEDRRGEATREETAHKVAWGAVKHTYEKEENTGKWREKKG